MKKREKTEATKGTQTEKMPALSKEQKEIAKKTEDLKKQPLTAEKPQVKDALSKAEKAMEKAAKSLDEKKGLDAVKNQDQGNTKPLTQALGVIEKMCQDTLNKI